ncbi:hypothetical protein GMRT_13337 [Giardia muris]|uniref:Myb-like domain-containing protein n=1 Tax=Giardia muris TaxID=5742 RepID=A0A4Z1SKY8_GIAMU|nr:hypothetical protein GMRT_13337 [Giardia muris]|eukprot:TNJ26302.1 hypothetical protein GMRT_13337 [Giardia muris]
MLQLAEVHAQRALTPPDGQAGAPPESLSEYVLSSDRVRRWSTKESILLLKLFLAGYRNNWPRYSRAFPGRSVEAIKCKFHNLKRAMSRSRSEIQGTQLMRLLEQAVRCEREQAAEIAHVDPDLERGALAGDESDAASTLTSLPMTPLGKASNPPFPPLTQVTNQYLPLGMGLLDVEARDTACGSSLPLEAEASTHLEPGDLSLTPSISTVDKQPSVFPTVDQAATYYRAGETLYGVPHYRPASIQLPFALAYPTTRFERQEQGLNQFDRVLAVCHYCGMAAEAPLVRVEGILGFGLQNKAGTSHTCSSCGVATTFTVSEQGTISWSVSLPANTELGVDVSASSEDRPGYFWYGPQLGVRQGQRGNRLHQTIRPAIPLAKMQQVPAPACTTSESPEKLSLCLSGLYDQDTDPATFPLAEHENCLFAFS